MVVVRVGLRLRFTKIPGIQSERIFRDTLTVIDPHDHGYQDISDIVERKIRFMDIPPCEFTIFHTDNKTNDTLVVDDAYLCEVLETIFEEATAAAAQGERKENNNNNESYIIDKSISFEVEIGRERPLDHNHFNNNNNNNNSLIGKEVNLIVPLTSEALQAHSIDGVKILIGALTCPPKFPKFFIRGVVIDIRFKTPKPNISVCEIDFCDVDDTQQQITSMTFDSAVQKAVRENLRSDRKQVVELRNIYIRVKNDTDKRFQTNNHPLLIRMDRGSKIEVVQVLHLPLNLRSDKVVTIRENLRPTGLVNLSDLAALREPHDIQQINSPMFPKVASTIGSSSSSSLHSGARRTLISFNSTNNSSLSLTNNTPISGVIPSKLGEQVKRQQDQFFSKRVREEIIPWEPDTLHVTSKDVRMRDNIVEKNLIQEEDKKNRIRRKKEVNQSCIICGINCEDESTLRIVVDLLKNNNRNMGRYIPTMSEIRHVLSDRRQIKDKKKIKNRLICSENFVDLRTRSLHVVHCRCVHLCTGYQKGGELEDIVFCELPMQTCSLCGMPGASVACYHPDCNEIYHTICALFSNGYVNFGKKDPYLPCPACPKHTQVIVDTSMNKITNHLTGRNSNSEWWEEDEVVFDSKIVEDTDLRDPDENDGA